MSNNKQPGTGQEWKEAFYNWKDEYKSPEDVVNWIEQTVVAPLQSQLQQAEEEIERLAEEVDRLQRRNDSLETIRQLTPTAEIKRLSSPPSIAEVKEICKKQRELCAEYLEDQFSQWINGCDFHKVAGVIADKFNTAAISPAPEKAHSTEIEGEPMTIEKLTVELEDKRISKLMEEIDNKAPEVMPGMPARAYQDMYYLSRKHTAEYLLDKYRITAHPSASKEEAPIREEVKATNIPDGENDWTTGAETFARNEVFKIIYTQRAMIVNDLKQYCWDEVPASVKDIVLNPRTPKI